MTLTVSLDNIVTVNHCHLTVVLSDIITELNKQQESIDSIQSIQFNDINKQLHIINDTVDNNHAALLNKHTDLSNASSLHSDLLTQHGNILNAVDDRFDQFNHLPNSIQSINSNLTELSLQLKNVTSQLSEAQYKLAEHDALHDKHNKHFVSTVQPIPPLLQNNTNIDMVQYDKRINDLLNTVHEQHQQTQQLHNTVEIQSQLIQQLQSQISALQSKSNNTLSNVPTVNQPSANVNTVSYSYELDQRVASIENKLNTHDIQTKVILAKLHDSADTIKSNTDRITELKTDVQSMESNISSKLNQLDTRLNESVSGRAVQSSVVERVNKSLVDPQLVNRVNQCESDIQSLNSKFSAVLAIPKSTPSPIPLIYSPDTKQSNNSSHTNKSHDELKKWLNDQFTIIYAHETRYTADIADIYNKLTGMKQNISDTSNQSYDTAQLVSDLLHRVDQLHHESSKRAGGNVSKSYVENELNNLKQLQHKHEKLIDTQLKSELKRFNNDMLQLIHTNLNHTNNHNNTATALGSMQFKCISCDQPTASISGPATLLFTNTVNGRNLPVTDDRATTQLLIDKSTNLYTYSENDDKFYKSRSDTPALYLKPGEIESNQQAKFDVKYIHEPQSVHNNAYGVNGNVSYINQENIHNNNNSTLSSPRPVSAVNYKSGYTALYQQYHERPYTSAGTGILPKTIRKK